MALEFDGVDQYISIPGASFPAGTEISISLRFYGDSGLTGASRISSFGAAEASGNRYIQVHCPYDEFVHFDCGNDGSPGYDRISKAIGAADYKGRWVHWVFLKDVSAGEMKIYMDGVLWHSDTGKTKTLQAATLRVIGARDDGTGPEYYYKGPIDDSRVYNRVLSPAEIKIIYNARGADNIVDGLLGRWPMNEKPDGETAITPALTEIGNVDNVWSHQGVATDGTYLYTSRTAIFYKRQMDGTLIDTHTDANLDGTDMAQINSIHIHDGKLYIGSNNWDTVPKLGYIKVFNADTLDYIEEHQVLAHWCEGCAYHDGYFWVVYSDWRYVSKYDTGWNHIADYQLTYSVAGDARLIGYQGITWKGDDIYCPIHDGVTPTPCVDRYHWEAAGAFSKVRRLIPPAQATQGICYLASNDRFYIAQRDHPVVGQYSVTITEEEMGNLILDVSGNGNHGTPYNSPVYRGAPVKLVRPVSSVPVVAEEPPPAKKTLVQMSLI